MTEDLELSADEVKNLLRPRPTLVERAVARRGEVSPRPRAAPSRANTWQLGAVVCAAAVAAIVGVVYLYKYSESRPPVAPAAATIPAAKPVIPPVPAVKKAVPAGPVVRVANPFDKREVFEFPPGTSQEEARDAVAKLLMDRATERRSLLSANPSRKRKSG
jgi:hypothetical protein